MVSNTTRLAFLTLIMDIDAALYLKCTRDSSTRSAVLAWVPIQSASEQFNLQLTL